MKTVSIFKNGNNQAIRLPKDMEYQGVSQLEIIKEGDTLILRPLKASWLSLIEQEKGEADFSMERNDIITSEGRF